MELEFVIKMVDGQPDGHPLTVNNLKHILGINGVLTSEEMSANGYAPFINNEEPIVSIRQNVENNGYFLDEDNFVKIKYSVVDKTPEELLEILNAIKLNRKEAIKVTFEKQIRKNVIINNVEWNGGFDSAIKLDAAKRLAESIGMTTVTFYDFLNNPHEFTMDEANTIITGIATDYQMKLATKQNFYNQIDAATTVEEVDAVVWDKETVAPTNTGENT